MNSFPLVDPIPVPAPVWLFKSLHLLMLTLHFTAMQVFLGGLIMATLLTAFGASSCLRKSAGAALAHRLPILITFVINFGVPPLLFAQILYGVALYTSSILIGVYWFSVILMLMLCYFLLYKFADGADRGRNVWWMGLIASVLALCISKIYSINMTLMLRPEVWPGMYSASASGNLLPPHDPTLLPRWLFMIAGALWAAGLWLVWIAGRKSTDAALGGYCARLGGSLAAVMVCVQAGVFQWVLVSQPAAVKAGIAASWWLSGAKVAWMGAAGLVVVFSAWTAVKKTCSYAAGFTALALTVVTIAAWVILRDGIRDLTLAGKGYDVWQQTVVTNWGVVGWFVLILLLGVAAMGWLLYVMMQSAKSEAQGGAR